ncbi:MAG: hypothetical protein WC792_06210 [Candidatus Micrarchaeia archaeon]|jgi:hypothetical protein
MPLTPRRKAQLEELAGPQIKPEDHVYNRLVLSEATTKAVRALKLPPEKSLRAQRLAEHYLDALFFTRRLRQGITDLGARQAKSELCELLRTDKKLGGTLATEPEKLDLGAIEKSKAVPVQLHLLAQILPDAAENTLRGYLGDKNFFKYAGELRKSHSR